MKNNCASTYLPRLLIVGFYALVCVFFTASCREQDPGFALKGKNSPSGIKADAKFVNAIIKDDNNTINATLSKSFNPDAKNRFGDTALIWAVHKDRKGLVRTLLEKGANPNLAGTYEKAPLHWAAENNLTRQIEILVRHGARVDIYDKKFQTPLHFAVAGGHLESVGLLLENGADPNWVNGENQSPLYLAVKENRGDLVEALVLGGADPEKVSYQGLSPLQYAVKTDRQRFFTTPAIKKARNSLGTKISKNIETVEVNLDQQPKIHNAAFGKRLHYYANLERKKKGLPALVYHEGLAKIATDHSKDMIRREFFDHVSPTGENPLHRAKESNFEPPPLAKGERVGYGIGENIYQSAVYRSRSANTSGGIRYLEYDWLPLEALAKQVIDGWMGSPGHRKNILSEAFTHQGFGIAMKDHRILVTQNFYYPMEISEIIDGRSEKPKYNPDRIAELVHESVNRLREEQGREPLHWDGTLAEIAVGHGKDMFKREFFDHDNPDGESATDRAKRARYVGLQHQKSDGAKTGIGENLSFGKLYDGGTTSTLGETKILDYNWMSPEAMVAKVLSEWWESPGHRANMLNKSYQRSGVGVVMDADDHIYIVHNFF